MKTSVIIIITVLAAGLILFGIYSYNKRKELEAEKEAEALATVAEAAKGQERTPLENIVSGVISGIDLLSGSKG